MLEATVIRLLYRQYIRVWHPSFSSSRNDSTSLYWRLRIGRQIRHSRCSSDCIHNLANKLHSV